MANNEYDIDQEMLGDFIDESLEALSTIPGLFVAFESSPGDLDLVEAIFRPIHSLKGNAAYFGLMRVKGLAHDMESILDLLRKERLLPDRRIIDGLLAGVDEISDTLTRTRASGQETIQTERFEKVHDQVRMLLDLPSNMPKGSPILGPGWDRLFTQLLELENMPEVKGSPVEKKVREIEEMLWQLSPPDFREMATTLQKQFANEKPASSSNVPLEDLIFILEAPHTGMTVDEEAACVLALLETLMGMAQSDEAKKILSNSLDEYHLFVGRIGYDPMLKDSLREAMGSLTPLQSWSLAPTAPSSKATPEPIAPAPAPPPPPVQVAPAPPAPPVDEPKTRDKDARAKERDGRTMRISEERVDVFLSYVGELIAVDEMLRYIHSEMVRFAIDPQISSSLLRTVNTFTKLSDDLQTSIMEIRKVSVKPMLQKSQRIVRDIASANGKAIDTILEGEDMTIDRSLLDTLEAPMVHMIRNAADHGIETPTVRLKAGKPERGSIHVAMRETEEMIVLCISDDGGGLNYQGIQAKAVKLGLLKKGVAASEETLKEMIFAPGFSTADQVTDVSGRGVGMDAVKRSVDEAGGRIELTSQAGVGTEFRIFLPKSVGTQILHSFVVQIGEERFVLPMDKISGSFRFEGPYHRLPNGTVCIKRNNVIYPVVCLDGPYRGPFQKLGSGILVTIENRQNPFVFFVDTILGMQKVVFRTIPWIYPVKFLGAAIMGDGRVSMIVNVDALCAEVPELVSA